jgi:DNA-binding LytR/AlgR family response regulator
VDYATLRRGTLRLLSPARLHFAERAERNPLSNPTLLLAAAHERIRQLSEGNRQLMRKSRKSASNAPGESGGRLLLHLGPGLRQAIKSDDVYFVEAKGDDTVVRTRSARVLKDVRPIGALAAPFLRQGFLRTHRNYLVNPRHVRQVRRRPQGEDWELTLDPPVNSVLPVSRSALAALWAAFAEE